VLKRVGDHKNCVKLIDALFCYEFCFVVMERSSKTLNQYLAGMREPNERSIGQVFVQMLSAIKHVHDSLVLHRDIKVENFLVGGEDGDTVKLCDFGLSVTLPPNGKKRGLCGTAPYMCPEMIRDECYDWKADVWSFGVVAYLLLFGVFPYATADHDALSMKQAIVKGSAPKFSSAGKIGKYHSDCVLEFVKALLNRDPTVRLSANDALQMPYMEMISQSCYMPGVGLPSLRPMLSCAIEISTAKPHDVSKSLPVDSWLNMLQMQRCGRALPEKEGKHIFYTTNLADDMYASEALSDRSTSCGSSKIDEPAYTSGSPSQCPERSMDETSMFWSQKISL
jgi:serine/threonine protein kinase